MASKIRRNDTVVLLAGDERGKTGRVIHVDETTAVVEGLNLVWKHLRRSKDQPQGARIQKEAAVPLSRLALLSPADGKPTKVGFQVLPNGSKVRICKRSKQPIPEPKA